MSRAIRLTRLNGAAVAGMSVLAVALIVTLFWAAESEGAVTLESVGSFNNPRDMRSDPDDPDRLFVVEKAGRIQLRENGATSLVLDMTSLVGSSQNEEGLLSLALAPDFEASGKIFVFYTTPNTSGNNNSLQVDEFVVTADTSSLATRRPILTVAHPNQWNHNGGQLHFGPDDYLYVSLGDGGGGGDPSGNGQNPATLLGTILRVDPTQAGEFAYTSPQTNPYFGTENDPVAGTRDEIWSWGLRNPWRWSFDRLTGDMVIGDVGQGAREEVNYRDGGSPGRGDNFGWSCREGLIARPGAPGSCATSPFAASWVDPVFDYPLGSGRCAIIGGYVVRDQSLGDLYGRYLYTDHCQGQIRSQILTASSATGDRPEGLSVSQPVSFGEDSCGRVYVMTFGGSISRLVGDTPSFCGDPADETIPPTVNHALSPPEPDGGQGWYLGAPILSLTANDNPGGSGINRVEYSLTGSDATASWQEYTVPVPLSPLADGEHSIAYRAFDNNDNASTIGSATVKIDRTKPTTVAEAVTLGGADCPNLARDGFCPVRVTLQATDPGNGSGVNVTYANLVPAGQPPVIAEAYTEPIKVDQPGSYELYYFSHDAAGNGETTQILSITVTRVAATITLKKAKKLKGKRTTFAVLRCPALATANCRVKVPKKAKFKLKAKDRRGMTKKQLKKGGKEIKIAAKSISLAPGGSTNVDYVAKKAQCKALKGKKLKLTVTIQVTAPGGAAVKKKKSNNLVCGKTDHF